METIEFNEKATFEIYIGVNRAIYYMEKDIEEWKQLNKNGGFKSVIEERQKTLEAMKKLKYAIAGFRTMKIEGD